jgi:hypothetical protein
VVWIGKPWALVCQFIPMVKRVNPLESKFFGVVACLKTSVAEFSHPLDQSSQARCHLWFYPLLIDMWWQQILV